MKKLLANILLIYFLFFSCASDSNEPMQIRHTKLNDYYADYIFNLKNDNSGLKMIIDFANESNEKSKMINDSLRKIAINKFKNRPPTQEEQLYGSFPSTSLDMTLYTPPSEWSLDRVNDKDIVVNFQRKEDDYAFTDIEIPDRFLEKDAVISEVSTKENKTILSSNKPLNLGVLKSIVEKTHKLNYHSKNERYTYEVLNDEDVNKLLISYNKHGKYLTIKM